MALAPTGRIARRNCRITFQRNEVYSDKYKNRLQRWTDYFTCSAYANTKGADHQSAQEDGNVVKTPEKQVSFECRWCPELDAVTSTGFRILFMGEQYNILSVDPMNYQRKTVCFSCNLEKRQERKA